MGLGMKLHMVCGKLCVLILVLAQVANVRGQLHPQNSAQRWVLGSIYERVAQTVAGSSAPPVGADSVKMHATEDESVQVRVRPNARPELAAHTPPTPRI